MVLVSYYYMMIDIDIGVYIYNLYIYDVYSSMSRPETETK